MDRGTIWAIKWLAEDLMIRLYDLLLELFEVDRKSRHGGYGWLR